MHRSVTSSLILIVDDEPVILETLERLLAAEGYDLAFAGDGAEALVKAAELIPDLILLDVAMPVMDGFEACRQLRADPLLAEVPVIMVTALGDPESRLQGLEAGADEFVSKPFDGPELLARVRTITKLNRYRRLLFERAKFERVIELSPNGILIVDASARIRLANSAMLRMLGAKSEPDIVGKTMLAFVMPGQCDHFSSFLDGVMADASRVAQVETSFVRMDGESFVVQVDAGYFEWDGEPAVQIVARDITQQKRAEEELRQRNRELALLNRVSQAFSSTLNLDQVLTTVLEGVRHLLGVLACSIWLIDPQTDELTCRHSNGPRSEIVRGWRLLRTEGLVGWVSRSGESVIVPDARADPRHFRGIDQQTGLELRSILSVPLRINEDVIGVLEVVDVDANRFNLTDLALVESLAAAATIAIENARLFEQGQREIVERKRAEEALRRRNEDLLALNAIATTIGQSLDLDHILNAALDKVLEVVTLDAGWVQLLDGLDGRSPSLAAHRGLYQSMLSEAEALKLGEDMIAEAIHSGQPTLAFEVLDHSGLSIRVGGGKMLHAVAAFPIKSRDQVSGVLSLFDRSPRELSSQEVQLLTAIGHQIGVAVENVRLTQEAAEIEILRELDRLRSELVANVSHELRTPLGLIKIFCTTLLREDVDLVPETRCEFLQDIDAETDKLEEIVDNLLDLSRMKDGQLQMDMHPADVGQLVREVMEAMEIQLTKHCFVYDVPSEPVMATVDPKRIEQVLRNLLSNAIRYSPEGGSITVQCRGDRRQLLIRVSDEGMGIPAQDIERVFERFYRVENEITRSVRGVGLGLAVCRGIVEAHGGSIWVESTLGVGSTFYVALPVGDGSRSSSDESRGGEIDRPQ